MHLQILDLDGSVAAQATLGRAVAWASQTTIDLRELAPRLRLWSRAAAIAEFDRQLDAARARTVDTITLLGSGDFHHLAAVLMRRAGAADARPFTVLHIDNHPDWVRLAPHWHCGAWVNRALELPGVARVVTVGVCSDDLVRPDLKGGNLPALASGRLVLFPWSHAPSRVWRRIADGAGRRWQAGEIAWDNLAQGDFGAHLTEIIQQLETDDVWITIDKDVLPEAEALSNWDQGQMPLARVLETIRGVGRARRIVGADICGEYSPIFHANWIKRAESGMDQPLRAVTADALARNERVNVALLRALAGVDDDEGLG